jgi:hypothetical protein
MSYTPNSADDARARAAAIRARRKARRRVEFTVGGLVTVIAMGATAVMLTKATEQASGCSALSSGNEKTATPVSLIIELEGNTDRDADAAAQFVSTQLKTSAVDVETAYDVSVVLVAFGEEAPLSGCLADARRLASPETDLDTYQDDSTSSDTKEHLNDILSEQRAKQIGWIVDEVASQVRAVDFEGRDENAPQLSPRLAWDAAMSHDEPNSIVAVMSPMISTVDDCFSSTVDNNSSVVGPVDPVDVGDSDAKNQVEDCKQFGEIATASATRTSIVAYTSDLDANQRRFALDTVAELCAAVTVDHCSATPRGTEATTSD